MPRDDGIPCMLGIPVTRPKKGDIIFDVLKCEASSMLERGRRLQPIMASVTEIQDVRVCPSDEMGLK